MKRDRDSTTEPTMVEIMNAPPELTSYGSGWQDINVETYIIPPGENVAQNVPYHLFNINTGITYSYESELDDRYHQGLSVAGEISLYPACQPMPYRWHSNISIVSIGLSQELLRRNARELFNCDRVELQATHSIHDPLLQQLGLALKADLESGLPGGAVYAQTMANAIAVHLLRNFSVKRQTIPNINGGLSPQKKARVLGYIDENIEQKILLEDLAAIAGLSQHHFARAFKQSFGSSPHQYLIQTRIIRAQQLLRNTNMDINEVAIACGFSNQSHLHRHFKKQTGITPRQFAHQRQYFNIKQKIIQQQE